MFKLSARSKDNLVTCDERLQNIVLDVLKVFDVSVICGYRGEEEQNKMFDKGTSQLKYPHGKHNKNPSMAVDIIPCPVPMKDGEWDGDSPLWEQMANIFKAYAEKRGVKVVWGGDWVSFKDKPHFEIVG